MSRLKAAAGDRIEMRGRGLAIGTRVDFLFAATEVEAAVAAQDHDDELIFTVPAPPAGETKARVRVTSPTGERFTRPASKTFEYSP
jgi:hypothetical protein